jgi:DICT domain-containing protein
MYGHCRACSLVAPYYALAEPATTILIPQTDHARNIRNKDSRYTTDLRELLRAESEREHWTLIIINHNVLTSLVCTSIMVYTKISL